MWTTNKKRIKKQLLTTEEAKEKALNLLEFRAHSRKELFDKLKRFTSAETANEVLDLLEDGGLIDDESYAFQYAYNAMELKYFGPARIKKELAIRGISNEMAEDAIWAAEKETSSTEERLAKLIEVKYKNMLSDEKNQAKTINALFRLGYGYDMIKEEIYKIKEETFDEF